jgi:hypothetical protein
MNPKDVSAAGYVILQGISKVYLPLAKRNRIKDRDGRSVSHFAAFLFLAGNDKYAGRGHAAKTLFPVMQLGHVPRPKVALQFVARSVPRENRPIECTVRTTFSFLCSFTALSAHIQSIAAGINLPLPCRSIAPTWQNRRCVTISDVGAEPYVRRFLEPDKELNSCWTINCP